MDEARPNRLIFRPEAIRRYEERWSKAVLPRFIAPRLFVFLWIVIGLLVVCGAAAWLTPVPIYASGPAVVVKNDAIDPAIQDEVVLVVFLPPENLPRLQVGQSVFLQLTAEGERISWPIVAVESAIASPESAQQRFGAGPDAAQIIRQPAAVAIVRLKPIAAELPATTYLGGIYRADVQVGSRRVISLLPVIGPLFGE